MGGLYQIGRSFDKIMRFGYWLSLRVYSFSKEGEGFGRSVRHTAKHSGAVPLCRQFLAEARWQAGLFSGTGGSSAPAAESHLCSQDSEPPKIMAAPSSESFRELPPNSPACPSEAEGASEYFRAGEVRTAMRPKHRADWEIRRCRNAFQVNNFWIYRGKASLTPPSTVRIHPVVFDDLRETRKLTASATSSGKIGIFIRLRF